MYLKTIIMIKETWTYQCYTWKLEIYFFLNKTGGIDEIYNFDSLSSTLGNYLFFFKCISVSWFLTKAKKPLHTLFDAAFWAWFSLGKKIQT